MVTQEPVYYSDVCADFAEDFFQRHRDQPFGQSFAPQRHGKQGRPREWVYVEHNTKPEWYVREQGWKLTHRGELFDMGDALFVEKPVPADAQSKAATAARQRLQAVLARLDPDADSTYGQPLSWKRTARRSARLGPKRRCPHRPRILLRSKSGVFAVLKRLEVRAGSTRAWDQNSDDTEN